MSQINLFSGEEERPPEKVRKPKVYIHPDQLDKLMKHECKSKGCGRVIVFFFLFGKRHPFNLDGTSHFDTCPDAARFRNK